MYYSEKLKEILKATLKGYTIGLVISIILTAKMGINGVFDFVYVSFVFSVFFGAIASMIICSKIGIQGYMNNSVYALLSFAKNLILGGFIFGGVIGLVLWIIKIFIGILILIPTSIYMASSYVFNLLYLFIMFIFERKNMLEEKVNLCKILDSIVPVLSLIVTVIFSIFVYKKI